MIGTREGQVTEMSFNKYPKEMKAAVVARILSGEETVSDIHRETRININTLYRWRDAAQQVGLSATTKYKNADKWSSQDKFTVVCECQRISLPPADEFVIHAASQIVCQLS